MPAKKTVAAPSDCHTREIPYRAGERRFARIAGEAAAVWLDSGDGSFPRGQFEIIAAGPERIARVDMVARDGRYRIVGAEQQDIFSLLQQWRRPGPAPIPELPFCGGTLGFVGYELHRSLEKIPSGPASPIDFPAAWFAYYPWALVQDIRRRQAWLVADSDAALQTAQHYLQLMDRGLQSSDRAATGVDDFHLLQPWRASTTEQQYLQCVANIQDLINAGDCYQVNLAQHFRAAYRGHPWHAYRHLRRLLPAPFSAFINTGDGCLLSHSPERFLRVDGNEISTTPIKGTRRRGHCPGSDARLKRELQQSTKDRAENLMIVDLLRNDLGRSCVPGSIAVEDLFALETYANVHHLVSTVTGRLRPELTPMQAFRNAFPGGSITGAPKIRAMSIIGELEPVSRSAYCGSVFRYSNHGRLDSSIAIRSLVADGTDIHCWGGGGIVADSVPAREYEESLTKIDVLLRALDKSHRA